MTYLDIIAGATELTGNWIVGNKNKWGFLINFICCAIWIAYVFTSKSTHGLLLVVIPSMIINLRNFIKWHKLEKHNKKQK